MLAQHKLYFTVISVELNYGFKMVKLVSSKPVQNTSEGLMKQMSENMNM